MIQAGAMLIYGRGGDLGNFKQFGDDLIARDLQRKFGFGIQQFRAERRNAFFDALTKANAPIKELHIFAHSFGTALVLGYHDDGIEERRKQIRNMYRGRPTPLQVVMNTEQGIAFVQDFARTPYAGLRDGLRRKFAPGAFIKIWGCNAALANHIYTDPLERDRLGFETGEYISSPDYRVGAEFYWRALNTGRLPSVATAMATFFNIPVLAAGSGAHIEINDRGTWRSARTLRRNLFERDDIRLHPDGGNYEKHLPAGR